MTTTGGTAAPARVGAFSLAPQSLTEAMEFAKLIAAASICPSQFRGKPADVLVAVQQGAELGMSPMQSLANIAVINGRATLWGDAVVALALATGQLEELREEWDPTRAGGTATVTIKRRGMTEHVETFSMEDAKRAKLDGKDTYRQYPQRMCTWRAKTWAIRAMFADALKGIAVREEADDYVVSDGVEVMMPRRRSATAATPAEVSGFLGGSASTDDAPADDAPPADAGGRMVGVLASVTPRSGETRGKHWTFFVLKLDDGQEASTFDTKIRDAAEELLGQPVSIAWEPSQKGGRKAVGIDAGEPGEEG
jgi:hypothetical protein